MPAPASLPGQSHYCLVAIAHQANNDPFTSIETNVDTLTITDRKVAQKNLHIVQFVVPSGGTISPGSPIWGQIRLCGSNGNQQSYNLVLDRRSFPGSIGILLPEEIVGENTLQGHEKGDPRVVKGWAFKQQKDLERFIEERRFNYEKCVQMAKDIEKVVDQPFIMLNDQNENILQGLTLNNDSCHTAFVSIQPSQGVNVGESYDFDFSLTTNQVVIGGSRYRVQIVPEK